MTTFRFAALALALSTVMPGSLLHAQDLAPAESSDEEAAEELATERKRQRNERSEEGWVLVIFGATSAVAGAVVAGLGRSDEALLAAGLGTMGWGLINIPFGIPMLDPGGGGLREIQADRDLRGAALKDRIELLAHEQYNTAGILAFNGGLDVFYVATGALLAVIGMIADPVIPALTGYGVAMGIQGLGLLAFDVTGWYRAQARGDRLLERK